MKKIKKLLAGALFLALPFGAKAQDFPKNEVKLNILNTIVIASVEVGYERYLDKNQSVDVEFFFNDRFSYWPEKDGDFKAFSVKLGYNYYFDLDAISGPYISPFIKQRFGKYTEEKTVAGATVETETSLNSFMIGLGGGYVWNYNDKFVIAPYVNIARNFKKAVNDKFWAVEPNAGIKIGYKF